MKTSNLPIIFDLKYEFGKKGMFSGRRALRAHRHNARCREGDKDECAQGLKIELIFTNQIWVIHFENW